MQALVNRAGWVLAAIVSLTVLAALAGIVRGGPLDPPGPPASTAGVLRPGTPIGSLPFTISQAGSYYLTKNLAGPGSGDGITVQASDVTIDLNGFTMQGIAGSQNAISEGGGAPARLHWLIKNGTIDGWVRGIYAPDVSDSHFSDLIINGASNTALDAGGAIMIDEITAHGNTGAYGILLGAAAQVRDCFVDGSGPTVLIRVADQSTITHCSTVGGNYGVFTGPASYVDSSNIRFAFAVGIEAGAGTVVTNNIVGGMGTDAHALDLYGNSKASGNVIDTIAGSGYGIVVGGAANRITANQIQHVATGLYVGSAGNTAYQNAFEDVPTQIFAVAGNQVGPIAALGAATNPWSNVTY